MTAPVPPTDEALAEALGEQEFALVISCLMAGRMSGPEAVASLTAKAKKHDAQVRAEAWDEGMLAQVSVGGNQFVRRAQNPYRARAGEVTT